MCSDTLNPGGEVRGCSVGCILGMSDVSPFVFIAAATRYMGFYKMLKNVSREYDRLNSCEYDRLNGWNSTLQAAWYIRHVRIIWFLWTKRTIWLLILSFTQNIVRACSCFILMKDIGRWLPWMLPGSTGRFSTTILCTDTIYPSQRVGIILSTILM